MSGIEDGRGRGPKCRRLKGFINNNKQNKQTNKNHPVGEKLTGWLASRQGRAGLDRAGQGRAGQDKAGQGRAGQGWTGQDKAGQGRTRQGRTRLDRTKTTSNIR